MKTKPILSIFAAALICAGCEGNGPNTQNGAVAGGALGALTGAIIGNNSGGHNGLAGIEGGDPRPRREGDRLPRAAG